MNDFEFISVFMDFSSLMDPMARHHTDSEVRLSVGSIEEEQTYTTTMQDPGSNHGSQLVTPTFRPDSVASEAQVAALQVQVAQQQSQLSHLQQMMQQLTQMMQQHLAPTAPKPAPKQPPVAQTRISPMAAPGRRYMTTPDMEKWMDGMLHGEPDGRAPPQPSPKPVHFRDLPSSTSAFRPNLMSTKRPVQVHEEVAQMPSVFSPAFRPCPGPVPEYPNGKNSNRRTILPEKYSGLTPLNEYLVHFELCAEINGWSETDKAKYLAVCLRGQAQALLGSIQRRQLGDYQYLVGTLQERFGLEGQTEIFMAELQTKTKSHKETYQELADGILRLVGKAYPSATSDTLRILSVQHFIKALTDKDLRIRIKLLKPLTIREAVLAAIEFEAIQKAEQTAVPTKSDKVRKVTASPTPSESPKPRRKKEKAPKVQQVSTAKPSPDNHLAEKLQQISSQLNLLHTKPAEQTGEVRPRERKPLDQVECFRCCERGHYASRCEVPVEVMRERQQARRAARMNTSTTPSGNA